MSSTLLYSDGLLHLGNFSYQVVSRSLARCGRGLVAVINAAAATALILRLRLDM